MAEKFFQMTQRNLGNTAWDNLYPQDKFETAGGTSTAIILTVPNLADGISKTFITSASNNSAATTINGKSLYKPNTTTVPNLIAGKAYTVWYNAANGCFFIKASAEGDAAAENVLAEKKFSNDNGIGISGTMPNNGAINITQTSSGEVTNIPAGYTAGGKVTNNITIESLGGKRWASSTATANSTGILTVNGLEFEPSIIFARSTTSPDSVLDMILYKKDVTPTGAISFAFGQRYPTSTYANVYNGGFSIGGYNSGVEGATYQGCTYSWIAIE